MTIMTNTLPSYLFSNRPVDPMVEAALPEYALWCKSILAQTHGQYSLPAPMTDTFLRSCCRYVRREARLRETDAALDLIKNRPALAWWIVDHHSMLLGLPVLEDEAEEEARFERIEREKRALVCRSEGRRPFAMGEGTARD